MIIVIDNYDSFTYNLVQYIEELGSSVKVYRNDEIDTDSVFGSRPEAVVISPGPKTPDSAGYAVVTGGAALAIGGYLVFLRGETALWLLGAGAFFVLFYTWPLKYIGRIPRSDA